MKVYLAVDIGASSGRHIAGWMENGRLQTKEVFRFPNGVCTRNGHLAWDIDALTGYVREGIEKALLEYGQIESLSVDTWGVDYVLMKGNEEIRPCYAYRDSRTEKVIPKVHEAMDFAKLYSLTGIQFQPFNTVYQLCADKEEGRLEGVTDILMMPEYLLYKLCGIKSHEYTNATTTGLVNAQTREYDPEIISALGLPEHLFGPLSQPGTVIGEYKGIRCMLCATHDTASAVEGIPMDGFAPYISSGTWSLLGIKSERPLTGSESREDNWSNEGGVGYIRYQKNIMGMWLVNRLRDELCPDLPFPEIVRKAEESSFEGTVDANDPAFLSPKSMKAAFDEAFQSSPPAGPDLSADPSAGFAPAPAGPQSIGDYFRCAYRSLAFSYRDAVMQLEEHTGKHCDKIYIVGGGAKNGFLNSLTQEISGRQVIALPIEATAIGNLKIQIQNTQIKGGRS